MKDASALIKIASAEIGYHEKRNANDLDNKTSSTDGGGNYTKYARDLRAAGYYNGNKQACAWCDVFVDWCFFKLCGSRQEAEAMQCQTGDLGAACRYSMEYFKQAGRLDMVPQVGDQVFFGSSKASHTGIVTVVKPNLIETIEGNDVNNAVGVHTYARDDGKILGFGHPIYESAHAPVQNDPRDALIAKLSDQISAAHDTINQLIQLAGR